MHTGCKITPDELAKALNDDALAGGKKVAEELAKKLGVAPSEQMLTTMGRYVLLAQAVYAFSAAYKIYYKAAEDAQLAQERRIEIEKLCNESIAQLKQQRQEMEELVNNYLLGYLEPFAAGVDAMDQALLDDDDDGYIKANYDLCQLLGKECQYRNAEEFDELMLSDEAFKL